MAKPNDAEAKSEGAGTRAVGVLALQGDFAAHAEMLRQLGAAPLLVRTPEQLAGIAAICLPGGESTTMSLLLDKSGLREPLRVAIAGGLPTLATCAGTILLARELDNDSGSLRVEPLRLLDCRVVRNAYGRQVDSFEAEVEVDWEKLVGRAAVPASGVGPDSVPVQDSVRPAGQARSPVPPLRAAFIRAPLIRDCGPAVQVLARRDGEIVLVEQENILAATFHPEIAGDPRLHQALLELVRNLTTKTQRHRE